MKKMIFHTIIDQRPDLFRTPRSPSPILSFSISISLQSISSPHGIKGGCCYDNLRPHKLRLLSSSGSLLSFYYASPLYLSRSSAFLGCAAAQGKNIIWTFTELRYNNFIWHVPTISLRFFRRWVTPLRLGWCLNHCPLPLPNRDSLCPPTRG